VWIQEETKRRGAFSLKRSRGKKIVDAGELWAAKLKENSGKRNTLEKSKKRGMAEARPIMDRGRLRQRGELRGPKGEEEHLGKGKGEDPRFVRQGKIKTSAARRKGQNPLRHPQMN